MYKWDNKYCTNPLVGDEHRVATGITNSFSRPCPMSTKPVVKTKMIKQTKTITKKTTKDNNNMHHHYNHASK